MNTEPTDEQILEAAALLDEVDIPKDCVHVEELTQEEQQELLKL